MRYLKRDNLIVLGVLAAMVIGFMVVVYIPQKLRLEEIRSKIATEKNQLASDGEKAAVIPEMLRQVQEMKKLYKNFDRRLPKQKELGGFLREISGRMAEEKLSDQLIEPGNPTPEEFFHTLPIIMKFKGSYLSLGNFLMELETMERLTRVQKLIIDSKNKEKESRLDIELQMNIYFTES